jgi:hypothetical protein
MEISPLKILDNDVSNMLCKQIRISREKEARKFHDNLFHNGEKLNKEYHDIILNVYFQENDLLNYSNVEYMNNLLSDKKVFNKTCDMIKYYYEQHIQNTKLQRT